jgi:ketosteroid isomerase-like protein
MPSFKSDAFAAEWAAAWNRRDLDSILAHFADDVVFSSPKAVDAVGAPTVRGKPALRAYWELALSRISALQFTVRRALWDPAAREIMIVYDRDINGRADRAVEVLRIAPTGAVVSGEVFYGVVPERGTSDSDDGHGVGNAGGHH